jgi:Bacterial regulatory protein, arsR family
MLNALMDGRALTATELALEAGVTPSTASTHLEKLRQAALICCAIQGRHRYFRIATTEVAAILESLMGMAAADTRRRTGSSDEALRRARICYNHLAGQLGVALLAHMRKHRLVRGDDEFLELTAHGNNWIADFGIELEGLHRKRRP